MHWVSYMSKCWDMLLAMCCVMTRNRWQFLGPCPGTLWYVTHWEIIRQHYCDHNPWQVLREWPWLVFWHWACIWFHIHLPFQPKMSLSVWCSLIAILPVDSLLHLLSMAIERLMGVVLVGAVFPGSSLLPSCLMLLFALFSPIYPFCYISWKKSSFCWYLTTP